MIAGSFLGRRSRSTDAELAMVLAVIAGSALLLVRTSFTGLPATATVLATLYVVLGSASLAVPILGGDARSLAPLVVAATGVAAIVLAAWLVGPGFPVPHGPEVLLLNSLAAVSEELFFRRLVYGGLVRFGAAIAIGGSALLFATLHVPIYGPAVFWVDLGAGLLLSWQRWASGGWGAPAATHVVANLVAVLR
ncbi:MAG: CPBP family intramembrane metalloprotease [Actinomycetota bacterium]|nr:CPBP family intramembrane metalloprotease [Actinomycetota bacterium]